MKCTGRSGVFARRTSSYAFDIRRSPVEIVGPALTSVACKEACIGEVNGEHRLDGEVRVGGDAGTKKDNDAISDRPQMITSPLTR